MTAAQAEPLLRDAIRVMRASGFHDGAAYAEIQLGRLELERGRPAEAAASLVPPSMPAVAPSSAAMSAPYAASESVPDRAS